MSLSLEKRKQLDLNKAIVQTLVKSKRIDGQIAEVKVGMDISASMSGLYGNGSVQQTFERLMPLAMQFDDNQSMEVYLFGERTTKVADLTLNNLEGYVQNEILHKHGFEYDTKYAGVIQTIVDEYAGFEIVRTPRVVRTANPRQTRTVGGFLGIGGRTEFIGEETFSEHTVFDETRVPKKGGLKNPVFLIFITDGNNSDTAATEKAIRDASQLGIFIHCVGIGGAGFAFLEKIDNLSGRLLDNVSFDAIHDLSKLSDSELYGMLLKEFPGWVGQAKQKNLIIR